MQPRFNFGSNHGNYPCCNAKALRFSTGRKQQGCTSKQHKPREETQELELMVKYFDLVNEPFVYKGADQVEVEVELTEAKESLMVLLKDFIKSTGGNVDEFSD
jgi:hypothetical protein